jgi:hypothetical protein
LCCCTMTLSSISAGDAAAAGVINDDRDAANG